MIGGRLLVESMVGVVNARPSASTGGRIGEAYVNAWRASLGTLVGRDWMAGVVDLLAMIVSKRRSSSWHLIRMPFLGCVLVVLRVRHTLRPRPHRLFSCVRVQYELADAGQTYGVNVAVTSVDARNVKFDVKVDDQPKP
ncbi:MAG: hypothetical protein WB777_21855 [Mycobacterium sp.]